MRYRAALIVAGRFGVSGQRKATDDLMHVLQGAGMESKLVAVPSLGDWKICNSRLPLFFDFLSELSDLVKSDLDFIHLNLGQSLVSFIREGLVWFCFSLWHVHAKHVISLHGHWFVDWARSDIRRMILRQYILRSDQVTVLGGMQKQCLVDWGIDASKIIVVNNTTDLVPADCVSVDDKHRSLNQPLRILFLGNLIQTKGYLKFLEALSLYTGRIPDCGIEVVLAGRLIDARFSAESGDMSLRTNEIHDFARRIAYRSGVSFEWIDGVYGDAKSILLQGTHIFVFPSKIEAQPIVLIEAMSQGAAIITSHAGEIPSMFEGANAAILIRNIDNLDELMDALNVLINSTDRRVALAKAARKLFDERFSLEIFKRTWLELVMTPQDALCN